MQTDINVVRETNLAPIGMECDAPLLKVKGELPRELNGTLYRNGPILSSKCRARIGLVVTACSTPSALRTAAPAIVTAGSHDAGRALFGSFGNRKLPDAPETSCRDGGKATGVKSAAES